MKVLDHSLKSSCGENIAREVRGDVNRGSCEGGLRPFAASHQIAIDQEHGKIHQNPCGQHEENGVEAQDVEKPQVVDSRVSQHLDMEKNNFTKIRRNGT